MKRFNHSLFLVMVILVECCKCESAETPFLVTTISNRISTNSSSGFGARVTAVGVDRVLIGAGGDNIGGLGAGAAYLFSTTGALLKTFTNPAPAYHGFAGSFGGAVAAVGSDKVLIGAWGNDIGATDAGAAYLFDTNGVLLTTFTNPLPTNLPSFGAPVAAVGTNMVLIVASGDFPPNSSAPAAYLFSIDGALLTTLTNPNPPNMDGNVFGVSVSAVGTDKVLIGDIQDDTGATNAGAAYLFSTNGTLLTIFTNPVPSADAAFGYSVTAVGPELVLIGSPFSDGSGSNAGAAYLFNTTGTLLTTFTNPAANQADWFGASVAAVGSDKVLIGAVFNNSGATNAGAVHVFQIDGTLLTTITNPTPAKYDYFGWSVAAVGTNEVIIGTLNNNTNAFLFSLGTPSLTLHQTGTNAVAIAWPAPSTGFDLENNADLLTTNWSRVAVPPAVVGNEKQITIPVDAAARFFRLHRPLK